MKDIALETELDDALFPVGVSNDRLVQVLLNLVLNAADAVHAAGDGGTIRVTARAEAERVVIAVEDSGPGIPEEIRGRVFDPFFTTKPPGEGTGLGLSISAAIVEQAGGVIRAEDRPDGARGARMVIELPRRGARLQRETLV